MQRVIAVLALVEVAAAIGTSDLRRATMLKPRAESGLLAQSKNGVFTSINDFMHKGGHRVAECETFTHEALNSVTHKILAHSSPQLTSIYSKVGDKRGFVDVESVGTADYNTTRDGKCAQALMVWAHHIPEAARDSLHHQGVTLPLMPRDGPRETHDELYVKLASCTDCHYMRLGEEKEKEHEKKAPVVGDANPPRWGGNNETTKFYVLVNMTDGAQWQFKYYYDDDVKGSRWEHLEGQKDSTCEGAVPAGEPCTVIYATDRRTYVQGKDICCLKYKDTGAVKSDWLQNGGAHYQGNTTVNGYLVDEWTKQGMYLNHYYALTNGYRTPVRFMEKIHGRLKQWDFIVPTWKPGPQAASLFAPPQDCDKSCPK